jgi:hypothetical protein
MSDHPEDLLDPPEALHYVQTELDAELRRQPVAFDSIARVAPTSRTLDLQRRLEVARARLPKPMKRRSFFDRRRSE